jgi:hypothetical protein
MSNYLYEKAQQILLEKFRENDIEWIKYIIQTANPDFFRTSETWLEVIQHHTSFELKDCEYKSLYAFMLYNADATWMTDLRASGLDHNILYPTDVEIGSIPLLESGVGSFKDNGTNCVLCPTTLHDRLKDKTQFDTLDYCISKYLESEDPYFFTFYYLSLGDILLKKLEDVKLTYDAQQWIFKQLQIAIQVEADLVRLDAKPTMDDLHDLMIYSYGSVLKDLNKLTPFTYYQYGLHYQYGREPLHYFIKKFFA